MLEIGSQVRIDTSDCDVLCENGCIPNHRKLDGRLGVIEVDLRRIEHEGHFVYCESCGHKTPLLDHIRDTGHFWGVCADGEHATFHTRELIETADVFEKALEEVGRLSSRESNRELVAR